MSHPKAELWLTREWRVKRSMPVLNYATVNKSVLTRGSVPIVSCIRTLWEQ